ncbi:MAG: hypothetical protein AAGU19_17820 [Prolixibacteraceae bacterium]
MVTKEEKKGEPQVKKEWSKPTLTALDQKSTALGFGGSTDGITPSSVS